MDELNRLSSFPVSLKLKYLNPGEYQLISLKKIITKYEDSVIAKLYDEENDDEKEYYLSKHHGNLSHGAIQKINTRKYTFKYSGMVDCKYVYELKRN